MIFSLLDYKVEEALIFLRENEPEEGYIVKFSGGKDSIVMMDIVKKSGVRYEARYNFTCLDPPEVIFFMKREYPEVKFISPKKSFWYWLRRIGPPTKAKRWCCTKLKHASRSDERGRKLLVGVRADESWKRRRRGRVSFNRDGGNWVLAPVFYFTEDEVWAYIEREGLRYPDVYDEGFERVACVVCPFLCGRERLLKRHMERWPVFYKKFEEEVRKFFLTRREYFRSIGIEDAEILIERWYMGKSLVEVEEGEEEENQQGFLLLL